MALAGLSTIGVKFGYGTGATKPNSFAELSRINAIGGLSLSPESIDASALTDEVTRRIAGRSDTDETIPITVNWTPATLTEWEAVLTAYGGLTGEAEMWFTVYHPKMTKGWFFKAQPPKKLPMPEFGQNSLLTVEIPLVVTEYIGMDTAVEPTT